VLVAVTMTVGGGAALAAGGNTGALLHKGSRGPNIAAVQRALGLPADGVYGARTRNAVIAFQRAHGLIVDGIVGPQTLGALGLGGGSSGDTSGFSAGGSGSGDAPTSELAKIASCESGGNPSAVSASGQYRGKYQFSRATWRSLGGQGDPAKAPEAVQDRMAATLLARSGRSAWPNCA
jgi:hypothetical protein